MIKFLFISVLTLAFSLNARVAGIDEPKTNYGTETSYFVKFARGTSEYNGCFTMNNPIKTMDDVRKLDKIITKIMGKSIFIEQWILLENGCGSSEDGHE